MNTSAFSGVNRFDKWMARLLLSTRPRCIVTVSLSSRHRCQLPLPRPTSLYYAELCVVRPPVTYSLASSYRARWKPADTLQLSAFFLFYTQFPPLPAPPITLFLVSLSFFLVHTQTHTHTHTHKILCLSLCRARLYYLCLDVYSTVHNYSNDWDFTCYTVVWKVSVNRRRLAPMNKRANDPSASFIVEDASRWIRETNSFRLDSWELTKLTGTIWSWTSGETGMVYSLWISFCISCIKFCACKSTDKFRVRRLAAVVF